MYLDGPVYNKSFIRPDDGQIKIEGLAVSEDSNANVRIFVDDKLISNSANRIKREDVDKIVSVLYGGNSITPNAGFVSNVDISNLGAGRHCVKVEQVSRYGDVIAIYETIINIENKIYSGEMCIDIPQYSQIYTIGEKISIGGWAVAEDEMAVIEIYIDNKFKDTASRYQRNDVIEFVNKYGNKTINPGFGRMIDSSNLSIGTHKLTIYEKSRYGDIIGTLHVPIIIKNNVSSSSSITDNNEDEDDYNQNNNTNNDAPNWNTSSAKGIDVSQFQGTIDWKKVANSGIKYAMIRIGYRGYGTGGFAEDTKFKTNFQNAVMNRTKSRSLFLFDVYKYSRSTERCRICCKYFEKI